MTLINVILSTADELRIFAASVDNKPWDCPLNLISEDIFLRWLKLCGVEIGT